MLPRPKGGQPLLLREHIFAGDDQVGDAAIVDRVVKFAGVGKDHAGPYFAAFVTCQECERAPFCKICPNWISWAASSYFDNKITLFQTLMDHRPAGVEPEAQAAIADVAAAEPEQAGFDRRMPQEEIIVLRHEDQAVLLDMVGDDGIWRLAAQFDADMLCDQAPLFKPSA